MKWKFPGYGTRRVKRKFAWLRTKLSNSDIIWLETYWQAEQFCDYGQYAQWVVRHRSSEPISMESNKIESVEHIVPTSSIAKKKDN